MNDIFISTEKRIRDAQQMAMASNFTSTTNQVTSSIVFVKLAEEGMIDEVTATENLDVFAEWQPDVNYVPGNIRKVTAEDGSAKLFKCNIENKSQPDWHPSIPSALWSKIGDPSIEFTPWSQPVGAHDAYQMGDKVEHKEKHWQSTANANVWEPGVYGWTEVKATVQNIEVQPVKK